MIVPFTTPANIDPLNTYTIVIESIIFGLSGLIVGLFIDKTFIKLSKNYKEHKIILSILQIALSGLVLGLMYVYISPYFTNHFQRTLSGLAFPSFFYGIQSNIYSTWQEL